MATGLVYFQGSEIVNSDNTASILFVLMKNNIYEGPLLLTSLQGCDYNTGLLTA